MSPIIFNIICDAVIREWEAQLNQDNQSVQIRTQFYADDGLLSGEDPLETQRALDIFTNIFAQVGLKMNAVKTKVLSMTGCKAYTSISKEAYDRRITGEGISNRERRLQKVECELCGATVNRQHLKNHQKTMLTPHRIKALEKVGFEWQPSGRDFVKFPERLAQLAAFKEEHGHCNVPQKSKDVPGLGEWVLHLRREYRVKKLKQERIDTLEAMGFQWRMRAVRGSKLAGAAATTSMGSKKKPAAAKRDSDDESTSTNNSNKDDGGDHDGESNDEQVKRKMQEAYESGHVL